MKSYCEDKVTLRRFYLYNTYTGKMQDSALILNQGSGHEIIA